MQNIDDALSGAQNAIVGLYSVHRLATPDRLSALERRESDEFHRDELEGFTYDFGGAHRQGPSLPAQAEDFGVTTLDPSAAMLVVFLAVAQIFGSRSASLNLSRYPHWCTYVCGMFFSIHFV